MASFGVNTGIGLVTNITGFRPDVYQVANFLVEIDGIIAGAFSDCLGLIVETETFDYREGGLNEYVHRLAGATKQTNLTLKHGMTFIDGLWLWHQDVVTQGKVDRRDGTIYLLNKQKMPVLWWDFAGAYPVKWTGPDLKADAATVAFETIELAHRGLSRPKPLAPLAGIATGVAGALDISVGFLNG